jgi:Flp pilus assembly protein TadG
VTAAGPRPARVRDDGQATVEMALAFPLVALMLLAVVQVTLVARDQIAVIHAAREGARAAALSGAGPGDGLAAARSATALDAGRLSVGVSGRLSVGVSRGAEVRVTVRYRSRTDVAIVGRLLGDITVQATATMRAEP